ncbi:MAG: M3 family peptidase, partial [Gammaproteobacteria bacterium]|nr:M3 family peptidase [Gammaproteobacteria bacterium]
MKFSRLIGLGLVALMLGACSNPDQEEAMDEVTEGVTDEIAVTDAELAGNPFMEEWDTPYGVPPFDAIKDAHYMPAFKKGILELRADIAAIVGNPEPPTFENTILAQEVAGKLLTKVSSTFGNITNTELNDELRALESKINPMLTREFDAINLNTELYARVKAVYDQRNELGLDEQDARLLELTHRGFVRSGAALTPEVKAQVAEINAEMSELTTQF